MKNNNIKFDWDDFTIYPTEISEISSRKKLNPYQTDSQGYKTHLPIMTAPMASVISDDEGFDRFDSSLKGKNRPIKVLERRYSQEIIDSFKNKTTLKYVHSFLSVGLEDIKLLIQNSSHLYGMGGEPLIKGICIDTANGHMNKVWEKAFKFKEKNEKISIMIGNIANPDTLNGAVLKYREKVDLIDYIRVGIGYGGACLTSVHTGIGYPMASLIRELFLSRYRSSYGKNIKIVADGGFKNYSEIIKALFLGADYVMLGGIFAKTLNTSGEFYIDHLGVVESISYEKAVELYSEKNKITKLHYGMSSKEAQKRWGNYELKTSEGVVRYIPIEYTTPQWIENFESYLRSSMSYVGIDDIKDFIGGSGLGKSEMNNVVFISENSLKRFSK